MNILHIAVGGPEPSVTALLEEKLRFCGDGVTAMTAADGSLLRKALCVTAKGYELVLLTGSPTLCREVTGGLTGDPLCPLTLPEGLSGWYCERVGRFWAWLPSEPTALVPLLYGKLLPLACGELIRERTHTVGIYGLPEAALQERLAPVVDTVGLTAVLYPCGEEHRLFLAAAPGEEAALPAALERVRELLGQYAYGVDADGLARRVTALLTEQGLTAAVAGDACDAFWQEFSADKAAPLTASARSLPATAEGDASPIRRLAADARDGEADLGVALLRDQNAGVPTVRLALADGKRVWCKTLTGTDAAKLEYKAAVALLDLMRRYLEALPAVIAGGEPLAAVDTAEMPVIPVSPLEKEQPVMFRKAQSRSEGIFKFCIIGLIVLFLGLLVGFVWYAKNQVPEDIAIFNELDELYQSEITGVDPSAYPPGMLSQFYALYNDNTDIRGWLRLNYEQSYPIMRGLGGPNYSRLNFYREPSDYGVPYFFPALPSTEGNRCLIVYGNNTGDGQMFSMLLNYLNESYVRNHPTVEMNTLYRKGEWQIFAVAMVDENDESFNFTRTAFTNEADFLQFVEELRRRSRFDISTAVAEGDELLLLTTTITEEESGEERRLLVAFRRLLGAPDAAITVTPTTTAATGVSTNASRPDESTVTDVSEPESSVEESVESSAETSEPEPSEEESKPETSSEPEEDDGGTEFIEPDEEEPAPTTKTTVTTTTTKKATTTTTTVTTTTTTEATTTLTTVTEKPDDTTDTTAEQDGTTGSNVTTASSAEATATTSTSASATTTTTKPTTTTTAPDLTKIPLREGVLNESEYYPLFRIKDSKTGKTIVPTTKEELQLGVFYVLKRELGSASTMVKSTEAQKAQAVAAYTYVLYYCSSSSSSYYTFAFDSYDPNNANDKKLYNAVGEVLGVKIIYTAKSLKKQAINAMYSCSSAGVSSTCSKVYTANLPYLVSVKSPYDTDTYIKKYSGGRDQSTATFKITYKELLSALAEELDIASAEIYAEEKEDVPVYATSWDGGKGGYVYQTNLYYYKSGKKTYIRGKDVRDAVNSYTDLKMRSHSFEVTAYDESSGTMTIRTKGYGHGLGLSQYGAVGYANEAGWTYDQILAHYYSITADTDYQLVAPKW